MLSRGVNGFQNVCGAVPSRLGEATVAELKFYKVRAISGLLNDSEDWVLHETAGRQDEMLKTRGGFQ